MSTVPITRPIRRHLARLLALLAALSGALAFAGSVQAMDLPPHPWRVYYCHTPSGTSLPLNYPGKKPVWIATPGAVEECEKGGRLAVFLGGGQSSGTVPAGTAASWSFNGPPFSQVVFRRSVEVTPGNDSWATAQYIAIANPGLEICPAGLNCRQLGDMQMSDSAGSLVGFNATGNLSIQAQCGGTDGGYCEIGPTPRVNAQFESIQLVHQDWDKPTASAIGGSALGAALHSGVETVSFIASDSGSGLADAVATINGTEVGRASLGGCAPIDRDGGVPSFKSLYECAFTADASVPVDTRRVPDGRGLLKVRLFDQSGQERVVLGETAIVIENVPPPTNVTKPAVGGPAVASGLRVGDQVVAMNGAWRAEPGVTFAYTWQRTGDGGWQDIKGATGSAYSISSDDVGHSIRVLVTATDSQGTTSIASEATALIKTGATIQTQSVDPGVGPVAGGDTSTAQLVVDREQRTVDVRHGAKIVITGRLVDADGQPIANAQVDVFEQMAITAAPWNKVGSVTTDSQGGYAYRPRTGGSRRLRFAYADQRNSADYRATREVFVSVSAGMTIGTKRHVISRKGTIRIKGRVQVDSLPKAGVWVEVQVLDAGVWRTVATRRTSRTGLWKFKHKLRGSAGITFKFRSRLRPAGDVASAEAKSAPVRVRVR